MSRYLKGRTQAVEGHSYSEIVVSIISDDFRQQAGIPLVFGLVDAIKGVSLAFGMSFGILRGGMPGSLNFCNFFEILHFFVDFWAFVFKIELEGLRMV